jgi:phage shock protein PspC (stress-responsive transcriptional regulator)
MNNNDIATEIKTLRRSRSDRMLSGVCGGAGKMLGIDPVILRLAFVALTLLGVGTGALLYLIAWVMIPEED